MQGPLKLSYFFLIFHVIVTIQIYIFYINYIYIYFVYIRPWICAILLFINYFLIS